MYTQQEIEDHLQQFTEAWKRYTGSWNNPSQLLDHLEACWNCNQELEWFYSHELKLWRDIVWEPKLNTFVLTESTLKPRTIYIASSVSLFDTHEYEDIKALVERNYPQDSLIFAKGLYAGSQDWLTKWPEVAKTVDVLLAFTHDGWIGRGVYTEMCDVFEQDKPVYLVDLQGSHHRMTGIPVEIDHELQVIGSLAFQFDTSNWRKYVSVIIDQETQEPTLAHCPYCHQMHNAEQLELCPLKPKNENS